MSKQASYRFYQINPSGQIFGFETIKCASDSEALAKAQMQLSMSVPSIEVWHETRVVGRAAASGTLRVLTPRLSDDEAAAEPAGPLKQLQNLAWSGAQGPQRPFGRRQAPPLQAAG